MGSHDKIDFKFFSCIKPELCHLQGYLSKKKFYLHNIMTRTSRQQEITMVELGRGHTIMWLRVRPT